MSDIQAIRERHHHLTSRLRTFFARSDEPEMIDQPDVPILDLRENLLEQGLLNRWLGGAATVLAHALPFALTCPDGPLRIAEIGCGGADLLCLLLDRLLQANRCCQGVAVDIHPAVLACAQHWCSTYPEIAFTRADVRALPFADASFDLVLLPDLLHHLAPAQAVTALCEARRVCCGQVIVSDLRRSWLAYIAFSAYAKLSALHIMSKKDGACSIRRAYTVREIAELAREAQLSQWHIYRHRYYRQALVFAGGV